MIKWFATLFGVPPILLYVFLIALGVVLFLLHDNYKYNEGLQAGVLQERAAWYEQRQKDELIQATQKKKTQDQIDEIAAANLALEQASDDKAVASFKDANRNSPTKQAVCLPRGVGRELNKIGR